jgi:hypothetical protein
MSQLQHVDQVPDTTPVQVRSHRRAKWAWFDTAVLDTYVWRLAKLMAFACKHVAVSADIRCEYPPLLARIICEYARIKCKQLANIVVGSHSVRIACQQASLPRDFPLYAAARTPRQRDKSLCLREHGPPTCHRMCALWRVQGNRHWREAEALTMCMPRPSGPANCLCDNAQRYSQRM